MTVHIIAPGLAVDLTHIIYVRWQIPGTDIILASFADSEPPIIVHTDLDFVTVIQNIHKADENDRKKWADKSNPWD